MEIELVIGLFFLLTLIGVPIAFSIAAASAVYMIVSGTPWMVAGQRMVSGADSFPLLAAPLFMLAARSFRRAYPL